MTRLLVSAFPAVSYLRLYYRSIESCKSCCLSEHNGDYDQHILLSSDVLADLNWVVHNLSQYNGCYFGPKPISLIIASHAGLREIQKSSFQHYIAPAILQRYQPINVKQDGVAYYECA